MNTTLQKFENCKFEDCLYQEDYKLAEKTIWIRKVDINRDLDLIHTWMNRPHVSKFWNMAWSRERIKVYLEAALLKKGFDVYLKFLNDEPFGYIELYDPALDRLKAHYDVEPGDVGIHLLVGEEKYLKRYVIRISLSLLRFAFQSQTNVNRLIGEPDENNKHIMGLMRFFGFRIIKKLDLPEKRANLIILNKEDFFKAHG